MEQYEVPCGGEIFGHTKGCEVGNLCSACQEIVKLREQLRVMEGLQLFANLQQVGKFAEAVAAMRTMLTPEEKDDITRTVARARLSAIARDIAQTVIPTNDPKYVVIGGKVCNAKTHEPIPDDEPIMIFRAKDKVALPVLEYYRAHYPYNDDHDKAIGAQILRFEDFACQKPERMKMPDT